MKCSAVILVLLAVACRTGGKPPDVVPPPSDPNASAEAANIDGARAMLEAELWRNLQPMVPPSGPPLHMAITVTLDNTDSPRAVGAWFPIIATAYQARTKTAIGTVKVRLATPDFRTDTEAGSVTVVQFVPDLPPRESLAWPLEIGDRVYVRFMIKTASGRAVILTSPVAEVRPVY